MMHSIVGWILPRICGSDGKEAAAGNEPGGQSAPTTRRCGLCHQHRTQRIKNGPAPDAGNDISCTNWLAIMEFQSIPQREFPGLAAVIRGAVAVHHLRPSRRFSSMPYSVSKTR